MWGKKGGDSQLPREKSVTEKKSNQILGQQNKFSKNLPAAVNVVFYLYITCITANYN